MTTLLRRPARRRSRVARLLDGPDPALWGWGLAFLAGLFTGLFLSLLR